jgi:hypothetical protein
MEDNNFSYDNSNDIDPCLEYFTDDTPNYPNHDKSGDFISINGIKTYITQNP